jgi:hypothetical protein
MSERQFFINDRVAARELNGMAGFVIGKFRLKSKPYEIRYAVEFDNEGDVCTVTFSEDELEKLPDLPDPPPVKAKVY